MKNFKNRVKRVIFYKSGLIENQSFGNDTSSPGKPGYLAKTALTSVQ